MTSRRYLLISTAVMVMFIILTAVFNYIIDPYGIYRTFVFEGINRDKPRASTQVRMVKAYGVRKIAPKSIAIGNSRVDIGIDPLHPAWPEDGHPVYNLGIPGSTIYASRAYLRHCLAVRNLSCVVMGLDFMDFPIAPEPEKKTGTKEFEQWLLTNSEDPQTSLPWGKELKRCAITLFSLTALADSLRTVTGQDAENITARGFNPLREYHHFVRKEGHYAIFLQRDKENMKRYKEKPKNLFISGTRTSPQFDNLRGIMRECRAEKINLYLYIHPYHVRLNETIRRTGFWPLFEQWKRELVRIVTEESDADRAVPLWDFSGYNRISGETVPRPGDTETKMKWYWEAGHYKKETGDMILETIFAHQGKNHPAGSHFGVRITSENIESHMQGMKKKQTDFLQHQTETVSDILKIYQDVY